MALEDLIQAWRRDLERRGLAADWHQFETHISIVILAGNYAYKFKKAVDFGFLDFSTYERRAFYCRREVELNRRYAPDLYLGVNSITAAGISEPVVRMRRFDDASTLDVLLRRDAVNADALAEFGRTLARAHAGAAIEPADTRRGSATMQAEHLAACTEAPLAARLPATVRTAYRAASATALERMVARKQAGRVRDCHGDLHASNVVRWRGQRLAFDCIEFNDDLRIIDTLSDMAFLLMDLDHYGHAQHGHAFLQAYLDESGDFTDLALLPVYLAYRSLVRAKVALLRDAPDSAAAHIDLAARYLSPSGRSGLVITHGVSGSGKSHQARLIARHHGFIHLRSDLERRRLAGATPSGPTRDPALYSVQHSQATYAYLLAVAEAVLKAGFSVIVDAAFLHRAERVAFAALATRHAAPFHILAPSAERDELEARIVQRQLAGGDPSEATIEVLTRQCAQIEPLTATERVGALADAVALPVALLGRARPH